MSIINEALYKTQQLRKENQVQPLEIASEKKGGETPVIHPRAFHLKWQNVKKVNAVMKSKKLHYLLILGLLTTIAYTQYQMQNHPPIVIVQQKPKEKISFTGVLVADDMRIAVLNKQIYHLGDKIKGMKISAIHQDAIELQRNGKVIKLRAGATYLV